MIMICLMNTAGGQSEHHINYESFSRSGDSLTMFCRVKLITHWSVVEPQLGMSTLSYSVAAP